MVCEAPRQRQLLVSRRGSFFEDPFFRDAWDDYSHAVRRIVDRFNRGWVAPSDRLRDSQYHSMYRTLRTARLNYSTHSARFKEEGDVYKLVMDVQEFVGGDITVRTAGGTVSVRGRMEVGADDDAKKGADDDTSSTISGRSTSAKTLHRRFTLPADANCEKVESSLSRDAILTVTIPKRTDVHYIPVNLASEGNKENEQSHIGSRLGLEGSRQPGVKRPSDSPLEQHRKKSQEEVSNIRRRRHKRDEEKRKDEDQKHDKGEERHSRRRSKDVAGEDRSTRHKEHSKRGDSKNEFEGKRRRKDEKEGEKKHSDDRRSRRRESKYEEVQEINIPVRISNNQESEKIFRPSSVHDPVVHNIEIEHEASSSEEGQECVAKTLSKDTKQKDEKQQNDKKSGRSLKIESEKNEEDIRPKSYSDRKMEHSSNKPLRLDLSSNKMTENKERKSQMKNGKLNNKSATPQESSDAESESEDNSPKEDRPTEETPKKSKLPSQPAFSNIKYIRPISVPAIDIKIDESKSSISENEESDKNEKISNVLNESKKLNSKPEENIENKKSLMNGSSEVKKDKLEKPKVSLFDRPASPVSPGSRLVKVEPDQTLMEEGIFKDCWSDFSNTLQDVLSRLQELSSELGQSKLLASTTPSAENSPPIQEDSGVPLGSSCARAQSTPGSGGSPDSPIHVPEETCSPINKETSSHVVNGDVGGVGVSVGGAKDGASDAHLPWRKGHGHSDAYDLDSRRKSGELKGAITEKALKKGDHSGGYKFCPDLTESFKAQRPVSLPLRNVASSLATPGSPKEQSQDSPSSGTNSLFVKDAAPGSLLDSLRKNSPVEALQDDFFRRSKNFSSSNGADSKSHVVPVEVNVPKAAPVGGETDREQRSLLLSPSDTQSNAETDGSETGSCVRAVNAHDSRSPTEERTPSRESPTREPSPGEATLFSEPKSSLPALNNLSLANQNLTKSSKGKEEAPRANLNFAPNIDTSPESNLSDVSSSPDEEAEQRHFTFPSAAPLSSKQSSQPPSETTPHKKRDVTNSGDVKPPSEATPHKERDVTNSGDVTVASKRVPEIPSDDAMGCERPLAPTDRTPYRGSAAESLRFSRANRPRDLLLQQEVRGHEDSEGTMGGRLSKGRDAPSTTSSKPLPDSPSSRSFSGRGGRTPVLPEVKPVPPYVRNPKVEPPRRGSGFAHINSDNVRRMRDVWGSKQDTKPPHTPTRLQKVPDSPTTRSSSEEQGRRSSRGYDSDFSRTSSVPSSEVNPSSFRRASPSPVRKTSPSPTRKTTPSYMRKTSPSPIRRNSNTSSSKASPSAERFTREKSPSRATSPPPYSPSSRKSSQGRASPVPSSPCRRHFRGARESPLSSPSLDRKSKPEHGRRSSNDKGRPASSYPSSNTPTEKYSSSRRSPPSAEPSRASKVHQKIFKRLRDARLQPDSEALCFKEEEDRYKMVLDVEEYVSGEIEVLQDDRVLTVKGRVEGREPGGHVTVKTFDRTFDIPKNSREEDIDSALSKDGILTIFVPKKRERVIKIELVD